MNAQGKKSLATTAGGILGAIGGGLLAGNPILGSKIGKGIGALATSGIQDTPQRKDTYIHSDVSPDAFYSTAENARPLLKTTWEMPQETKTDNALAALSTFAGPLAGFGMEEIMKKFAPIAMDAVPAARRGTFIPPQAPSHEQGGVKLINKGSGEVMAEAEGNEYVIPGQSVDQILDADSYAEIGRRFINEIGRLEQKGMNEFMAQDGLKLDSLLAPNPYVSFNRHQRGVPFAQEAPQTLYNAFDMVSPVFRALGNQTQAAEPVAPEITESPVAPPAQEFNYYGDDEMDAAFGRLLGRSQPFSAGLTSTQAPVTRTGGTQKPADSITGHFNKAIDAQKRANKQGNLLRFAQGLINFRSLMEPMRPSAPMTLAPFQRVEYADESAARINQANRELGMGLEAFSQLSAPERIAGVSGLMGNYGQAMAQISEAKTAMMNRQAEINAQIDAQEKQAQLAVDAQNREMRTAEAASKHARDQVGLAGIYDAISGMIESSTQKDTNVAELSVIRDIMAGMKDDQKADFLTRMAPILRASGINFNPTM